MIGGRSDAEDLLEHRKAKRFEGNKRSLPLSDVKRQLGKKGTMTI